jgi:hypothetical protein
VASAVTSAATTAATFALLRTRFVDYQGAAHELPPVESCNHFLGFRVIPNFGESETARLAREPIAKQGEGIRLHARFRKQRCYIFFCGLERKIAHVQFLHRPSPYAAIAESGTSPRGWKKQDRGRGQSAVRRPLGLKRAPQQLCKHLAAS